MCICPCILFCQESDSYPAGYFQLEYTFDFFNYAGIHRPVVLYSVPAAVSIRDIRVDTSVVEDLSAATVAFNVTVDVEEGEEEEDVECSVKLVDADGAVVTTSRGGVGDTYLFDICRFGQQG